VEHILCPGLFARFVWGIQLQCGYFTVGFAKRNKYDENGTVLGHLFDSNHLVLLPGSLFPSFVTTKLAGATLFNQNLCLWAQSLASTSDVVITSMFLSTGCPNTADPYLGNWAGSSFCYDCEAPSNSPSTRHDTETLAPTDASESVHDTPGNIFSNDSASREKFLVFTDGDELRIAVDKYLLDSSPTSNVAAIYGYPIGTWNVSLVVDFGFVFDADRNSMTATFDDDLSGWDTSSAETMERMFAGATTFRGDVSTWSTGRVRTMQGMCRYLQSGIDMKNHRSLLIVPSL
jgi:hypothetical protein